VGFHEVLWDSMRFHEIPWSSMRFYDVPVNRSVLTEANRGLTSYTEEEKAEEISNNKDKLFNPKDVRHKEIEIRNISKV
jgi:hypothetical protein